MKGRKEHETKAEERREERHKKMEHRARGGGLHEPHEEEHRGHRKVHVTKKRGGSVHGKAPHHRLDRKARGGRMTPQSPLSGAGNMKELPYEHDSMPKIDEGGKGKEKG